MIRLKDIATRAGCSMMTVSRALRGGKGISDETRARILLLAQQLGYVPDSQALGLRNRHSRILGLVLPTVVNPVFARTVAALEERCSDLGYDLILAHTLNSPEREECSIKRLLSRQVAGFFIFPVYRMTPEAPIYQELARHQRPVVILGHNAPFCAEFANVETDDLHGSYQVTRHLLGLGHERIAFFAGPRSSPHALERLEGYRRALREAGIDGADSLVFAGGSTIEEGEQVALQFLSESSRATAVQAANDLVAIGAMNLFLEKKIKIPQDLSVAGYGNILMSRHCRVALTTVRQPKMRLGYAAMEVMLKLLQGEKPPAVRLPAELLVRESTGTAKR
jgi:DNA-binding LacI/PurR family transcriptional regulator